MKQKICKSFKRDILKGLHKETDEYKIALFTKNSNIDENIDNYNSSINEVIGQGYMKGGQILTGIIIELYDDIAVLNWNQNVIWRNSTITARRALIYNN